VVEFSQRREFESGSSIFISEIVEKTDAQAVCGAFLLCRLVKYPGNDSDMAFRRFGFKQAAGRLRTGGTRCKHVVDQQQPFTSNHGGAGDRKAVVLVLDPLGKRYAFLGAGLTGFAENMRVAGDCEGFCELFSDDPCRVEMPHHSLTPVLRDGDHAVDVQRSQVVDPGRCQQPGERTHGDGGK
jgi:hypothetical protein